MSGIERIVVVAAAVGIAGIPVDDELLAHVGIVLGQVALLARQLEREAVDGNLGIERETIQLEEVPVNIIPELPLSLGERPRHGECEPFTVVANVSLRNPYVGAVVARVPQGVVRHPEVGLDRALGETIDGIDLHANGHEVFGTLDEWTLLGDFTGWGGVHFERDNE